MRQLRYIASLAIMLLATLPMQAQTENQAFYIYQNDGHFDGFFYDEIEKMSFSFLDTLGVEHDEIVSQEIVTADSTYRIMLSAIDSIGFVQPEMKYNPQVHIAGQSFFYGDFELLSYTDYGEDGEFIYFSKYILERTNSYYYDEVNDKMEHWPLPQVGDVFVDFDKANGGQNGWCAKIDRLYYDEDGYLVGVCKPIDDITDIFQQFVAVEEYGYDDEGQMIRRRVAGHPELSVGDFPKKSSRRAEGTWEGDLFNFSMNSNIPLYASDNLNVNIITAIEGKVHVKSTWNLSLFGDKYINILTKLNFGVAGGFSIDGSISKTFDTGVGEFGSIPVPAACPILCITIGPDVFLRGEAHVNFTAMTPKAKGSFWTQLEINNWVPRMDMGFGTPEGMKEEEKEANDYSAKISLNGFVQAGLQFPLTFGSLPTFKKFFNFSAGSKMYLGPKLGADFTIDLKEYDWDASVETVFDAASFHAMKKRMYTLLLNTKLQLHMLDVDFDVKSKMETALSGVKEATLFSGSASLLPALDLSFVPQFSNCEEYTEDKYFESDYYGNQVLKCRVFAFKPSGLVIKPVDISAQIISRIKDDGTEVFDDTYFGGYPDHQNYYHVTEVLGQDLPKDKWARLTIPYRKGRNFSSLNGKFKVSPYALAFGREAFGSEEFEFEHGAVLHVNGESRYEGGNIYTDMLYLNADGTPSGKTFEISGNCDSLAHYSDLNAWIRNDDEGLNLSRRMDELQIVGSDGNFTIEKNPNKFKNSYNPCDTIQAFYSPYGGVKTIEGEIFESFVTERRQLYVYKLPNKKNPKTCNIKFEYPLYADFSNASMTATRRDDGRGWHLSIDSKQADKTLSAEFDVWFGEEDRKPEIVSYSYSTPRLRITKLDVTEKKSDTHTVKYTLKTPGQYRIIEVQEGLSSEKASGSLGSGYIPFNITETEVRNGKTETTQSNRNIYMDYKILF